VSGVRSGPAESLEGASPRLSQVLARRTVVAVAAIVILSVPFAVFAAISGQVTASSWAALGGVVALTNLMIGGPAIAYLSVGLLTALTPVAIVSGTVPVAGAGLMAIMCFGVGLSAAQGLHRGMLLIPMYLAFMIIAPPPWSGQTVDRTSTSYLLWNMLFLGGGALWAALVFPPLLRKQKMMPPRPEPWPRNDTLVYTTTITVLCTASTLGVLIWRPGSNGAWLVLTLLVVTQFGADTHLKRTLGRVANCRRGRDCCDRGISERFRSRVARYRPGPTRDHGGDHARPPLLRPVLDLHYPHGRPVHLDQHRRCAHYRCAAARVHADRVRAHSARLSDHS
jgi:hypothetical protein